MAVPNHLSQCGEIALLRGWTLSLGGKYLSGGNIHRIMMMHNRLSTLWYVHYPCQDVSAVSAQYFVSALNVLKLCKKWAEIRWYFKFFSAKILLIENQIKWEEFRDSISWIEWGLRHRRARLESQWWLFFLKIHWFSARFLQIFSAFQHISAHFHVRFCAEIFEKSAHFSAFLTIFLHPGTKKKRGKVETSPVSTWEK